MGLVSRVQRLLQADPPGRYISEDSSVSPGNISCNETVSSTDPLQMMTSTPIAEKKCVITETDFLEALSGFNPSLTPNERLRYERIYSTFISSRGGDFADLSGPKKQTLA
eukprot:TRINITY_DN12586_c0_g1_i2.p1 TRINITY_DN12586_c0_g1~~TRINITY_DN12586_c0_g1_i2.p1  ORF type:complete len:110 (-),score=21.99 TRINITY_DN12586_c0_g1_i2:265-594(-)